MVPTYLRHSALCFLVFSLANSDTFAPLSQWLNIVRDLCPELPIILVGNKMDPPRQVSTSEAEQWRAMVNLQAYAEHRPSQWMGFVNCYQLEKDAFKR
jgi:GTPase SAR1 family protein